VIEHAGEARALQRKDSEFGKKLLLANALAQRPAGQVIDLLIARWRLDDRVFMIRWLIHLVAQSGYAILHFQCLVAI
jgi:hypothetical protein